MNSTVRTPDQLYLEQILADIEAVYFISHNNKKRNSFFRHKPTGNYFYLRADDKYIYFVPDDLSADYKEITTEISSQLGAPEKSFESMFWKKPKSIENIIADEPKILHVERKKQVVMGSAVKIKLPKNKIENDKGKSERKLRIRIPHNLVEAKNHEFTRKVFGSTIPEQFRIIGYQEKRTGLYVRLIGDNDNQNNYFWIVQEKANLRLVPDVRAKEVPRRAVEILEIITGKVAMPLTKKSSKLDLLEKIVADAYQLGQKRTASQESTRKYEPRNLIDAANNQITKSIFSDSIPSEFSVIGYQNTRDAIFVSYKKNNDAATESFWIINKGKSRFKLSPAEIGGKVSTDILSQLETITGKVAYPVKRSERKYILMDKKVERVQKIVGPKNLTPYHQTQAYMRIFNGKAISRGLMICGYDSQSDRLYVKIEPVDAQGKPDEIWLSTSYHTNEIKIRPYGTNSNISQNALDVLEAQFGLTPHVSLRSNRIYRIVSDAVLQAEKEQRERSEARAKSTPKVKIKKEPRELNRALPNTVVTTANTFGNKLSGYLCDAAAGLSGKLNVFAYDEPRRCLVLRDEHTRKLFSFGIGFNGKCVYLRQDGTGLEGQLSDHFVKNVAEKLGTTSYEFLRNEKAQVWYVSGLVEKFPEIKN